MDIKKIIESLSEEEQAKYEKFVPSIAIAMSNPDASRIYELLEENNLKIKAMVDFRVLCDSYEKANEKIEILKENNLMEILDGSLELLRRDIKEIVQRINMCKKAGKGYVDSENKLCDFILNSALWVEVEQNLVVDEPRMEEQQSDIISVNNSNLATYESVFGVSADIIREAKESNNNAVYGISNEYVQKQFRVHDMVVEILKTMYGISDLEPEMENDLKCLVSTPLSDVEIAKAVILLSYIECGSSKENVEPVKEYLDQVVQELNFEGSYGVVR